MSVFRLCSLTDLCWSRDEHPNVENAIRNHLLGIIYCALTDNTFRKSFLCVVPWSPSLDPLIVVLDAAEDRDVIGDLSRLGGGVAGTAVAIRRKNISKCIHKKITVKKKKKKKKISRLLLTRRYSTRRTEWWR